MFRFTIRDVLWLTVVVAAIVAWRVDRRQQASDIKTQLGVIQFQQSLIRCEAPWCLDKPDHGWAGRAMRSEAHAEWERTNRLRTTTKQH